MTYKQAQSIILAKLAAAGWETRSTLKFPWARNPITRNQFYFYPQSIHLHSRSIHACPKAIAALENPVPYLEKLEEHFSCI